MFPGPDATIPPLARTAIPGLGIEALAAVAESAGLTCRSIAGAYPEEPGRQGYDLACDGVNPALHAELGVEGSYWTLDAVSDIHVVVSSDDSGAAVGPSGPAGLFSTVSDLATSGLATTWVLGHLHDQTCTPGCIRTVGTVRVELNVGVNGAAQLNFYGYAG